MTSDHLALSKNMICLPVLFCVWSALDVCSWFLNSEGGTSSQTTNLDRVSSCCLHCGSLPVADHLVTGPC